MPQPYPPEPKPVSEMRTREHRLKVAHGYISARNTMQAVNMHRAHGTLPSGEIRIAARPTPFIDCHHEYLFDVLTYQWYGPDDRMEADCEVVKRWIEPVTTP